MYLMNRVENENNIFYLILFSFCITFFTSLSKSLTENVKIENIMNFFNFQSLPFWKKKRNEVFMSGLAITYLKDSRCFECFFSQHLQALNFYLMAYQNDKKLTVNEANARNWNRSDLSFLYVVDVRNFLLCEKKQICCEIFAKDEKTTESNITSIYATVYSYNSTVESIVEFLNEIQQQMDKKVEEQKLKLIQPSIFSLKMNLTSKKEGDNSVTYFNSVPFESTRDFSNIFFDSKSDILKKINFFLNNKKWYFENGIPYSLGIGLHGEPGTGKTSFIKALANYTKRHIVVISLKEIDSKSLLDSIFHSKEVGPFEKKIIVFEDIDCIGDIVLSRDFKFEKEKPNESSAIVKKELKNIVEEQVKDFFKPKLTLDDILNLWDGVIETPGRIMILTSNHYDKLDSALIRPGRIDLSVNLTNASRNCISEMYSHYYKKQINKKALEKIANKFYSPAEIVNIYVKHHDSSEKFIQRLQENKKVQ